VAWVFRHFPLDQLHPTKARLEAIASECASELAGGDAFWQFANQFFALTPSNNQTDLDVVIPLIVKTLGIDQQSFDTCINSGRYETRVESDIANAIETGGQGTPWSVVIMPNGETLPLSGSLPYTSIQQFIEITLKAQ